MRGKKTVRSIKNSGRGFLVGKINQRKGRLFCMEEKKSFTLLTHAGVAAEGIASSILINPIIKAQLIKLGYVSIGKGSQWGSIADEYEYVAVLQLEESVSLFSQGKKYKMI